MSVGVVTTDAHFCQTYVRGSTVFNLLAKATGLKVHQKFGKLRVAGHPFYGTVKSKGSKRGYQRSAWCVCLCLCKAYVVVTAANLKSGFTKSCGCTGKKHGLSTDPLYCVWHGIISRCYSKKSQAYRRYGGRGIGVCVKWRDTPKAFIGWAMANGYEAGMHVDRKNNDRGYSPTNCRFVTPIENARNRSDNRSVVAFKETKVLAAWAEDCRCVVTYNNLKARLNSGWDAETALTRPKRVG